MELLTKGCLIDERYEVVESKGGGGFGQVVSVIDLIDSKVVALKYCISNDDEHIRRFKREVKIMASIDHGNVIKVIEANLEYDPPYFTMPLAKYSITKMIPELQNNLKNTLEVFKELCNGVSVIHASGFTHRDIKPDNALVFEDDQIVLSDLGLARLDERDSTILTKASSNILTEDYAPPEQFGYAGTRDLDHRGDIYMLGKTLYHLLTNERPKIMNPKAVSAGVWYIIQKATRHDVDERYQTVGQLLDALFDLQRASDPKTNPKEYFMTLLDIAEEKLERNEYDHDNALKLIQCVYSTEDNADFIKMVHDIPLNLLGVFTSTLAKEFEGIMEKYCKAIKDDISVYPFSFADIVGTRMKFVFKKTKISVIKKNALLSIMFSGVKLNRFSVKDQFDELLTLITDDEDAFEIAGGLRDELQYYKEMYTRVPKKELHQAIQIVWELCETTLLKEATKRRGEYD